MTGEMQPFWMVYGIGCGVPIKRHESEILALAEAERLARRAPGTTYVVLEATRAVRLKEFDHVDLRAPAGSLLRVPGSDDIPF